MAIALTFDRLKRNAKKNSTKVERLRNNVLKAGLRKLSLSYSRISLADVAERLQLDSAADAEAIVAKAIRDGCVKF